MFNLFVAGFCAAMVFVGAVEKKKSVVIINILLVIANLAVYFGR